MSLSCYRSIVFSDMPLGMHETFLKLRGDHAMVCAVGGLVVMNQDGTWGYAGGEAYGEGQIEDGLFGIQAVVDRLTSRSTRLNHPEYQLDAHTHCLLVTTSDSDLHSIGQLVEAMGKTMPEQTRCDWLHIEWSDGLQFSEAESLLSSWNGGEFDRSCIRNRTASEKVEYGDREWSAAVIQYLESRMLEKEGAIQFDEIGQTPKTFGFATLDFSQTEGRRFLEAKAFLDVVEREEERIDLDLVFRRCSEALKGGNAVFSKALSQSDLPQDLTKEVSISEAHSEFNVRERLAQFRDKVTNEGGTIEMVERTVEEGIEQLKSQVEAVLKTSDRSAQERLSIIQSLLGQVPERTHGKPLRTTLMLDDCERDCLAQLASLSEYVEEAPSVQELHVQRRFCVELSDNMVSLNRAIGIDDEAGLETADQRKELLRQEQEFEGAIAGYNELRKRYTGFRRGMFASLSTQWMEGLFERLVRQATYEYEPQVVEEKPLLSKTEKRLLMLTGLILPMWLWLAWKIDLQFWLEQTLLTGLYALVWAVVISLRLRRPKKAIVNPMVEQRKRWIEAARTYHGAMVRFAALTRFQKRFDEQIRKPLILERNRLTTVLDCLREHAHEARLQVSSSFTDVGFIQHIGDADSFNKYYEYELSTPMVSTPSIVQVYLELMESKRRHWTEQEAVTEYKELISERVNDHMGLLKQFDMMDYLLEREHMDPPLFVDPDLPPFEELIRRATISLGALHDCGKESDGQLTILLGRSSNTALTDRFREQIGRLFPESRQSRLDFVATEDPNRIGFLRVIEINLEAMKRREKQDARRVRRRRPAQPVPKSNSEQDKQKGVPPPPVNGGEEHGFGQVEEGRLMFRLRGNNVGIDLPKFSEVERRAILDLEHFERGVRLVPGQDAEEVVFSRILGHAEHDVQLEKVVTQARSFARQMHISLPEVLIGLVQSIPYQVGAHEKYPIETLMLGYGDCSDKSTLLKKLLGMCGVNSVLLLYEGLRHMALGIAVPSGSEGHLIQGYAFLEATAPFVVGNDPVELVSGRTPKNAEVELLLSDPSLSPWSGYSDYREAAKAGFPSVQDAEDDTFLRNSWREQS